MQAFGNVATKKCKFHNRESVITSLVIPLISRYKMIVQQEFQVELPWTHNTIHIKIPFPSKFVPLLLWSHFQKGQHTELCSIFSTLGVTIYKTVLYFASLNLWVFRRVQFSWYSCLFILVTPHAINLQDET